ncbi:MAG: methionyl-tRNA formyltransferase, partial [Chloroflexota bacterium]
FVIPVLDALIRADGVEVVGVYTPPDRPSGRGRSASVPPVKGHALAVGLPVYQPATLRSARAQAQLAALNPDIILVAAYGKLLPPEVLKTPPHGCLNLHPSLLPRHRGPSPVATAILEGDAVTGVTLMLLDEVMDTGPIIAQREHPLSPTDTAETLTAALFQLGVTLLKNLGPWVSGQLAARPQEEAKATTTHKLERAHGEARWELSAMALERHRLAYTPWPGLFTHWEGKVLKLLDVVSLPTEAGPSPEPGQVVLLPLKDVAIGVGTGQGILGLKALQLEGRRPVTGDEFRRGYPRFIGARL